ncbi:MAG: hypothetical protein GKS01_08710 [Alphaproteobacteria bacterium]|nr:hypothetical protein [Alphaproteobacteria bacterium]
MSNSKSSSKEIVLVHSSDIHVDDGYTARANDGDGTNPLLDVLRTAEAVKADIVMLVGDVFEHNRLASDIVTKAASHMGDAPMHVVALPGNHDPVMPDSPWYHRSMAKADRLHILGVTHKRAVQFPEFDLEIWGQAHRSYDDMNPLSRPRKRKTRWQVALAHGHYEPVADRRTTLRASWLLDDAELAASKADYVALGHWNQPIKVGDGAVPAYYSGSPDLAKTVNVIRLTASGDVKVKRQKIV